MFKEALQQLSQTVPGSVGALIMGLDGIPVDKHAEEGDLNLEALSAEYLSMVKKAAETNRDLGIGPVVELTIFTDALVAILLAVTSEYFIVFALRHGSNYGRARYEARKSAMTLAKELS